MDDLADCDLEQATITWTASSPASAIKTDEFDGFEVSVDPLRKAVSMQFKTLHLPDGTVVRWIDPEKADGSEPAPPIPTLQLTPAAEGASATPALTGSAIAAKSSSTTAAACGSCAASHVSVNTALGCPARPHRGTDAAARAGPNPGTGQPD